jgi:hypothetical protein
VWIGLGTDLTGFQRSKAPTLIDNSLNLGLWRCTLRAVKSSHTTKSSEMAFCGLSFTTFSIAFPWGLAPGTVIGVLMSDLWRWSCNSTGPGDMIWVQDYQRLLVTGLCAQGQTEFQGVRSGTEQPTVDAVGSSS